MLFLRTFLAVSIVTTLRRVKELPREFSGPLCRRIYPLRRTPLWCTWYIFGYTTRMDFVIEANRRERKRQAVHDSLLMAGNQLFREHGVTRTTVDDIVGLVDVARQTFFNHFPYKEALALELGAEGIHHVAERAHALLESGCSAVEVLKKTAEWMLDSAIGDG